MTDLWQGLEYTVPCWPDGTGRSGSGLHYSGAYQGVSQTLPAPAAERRPARNGAPVRPYVQRLNGLPSKTNADYGGFVSGCAVAYETTLPDHQGNAEIYDRTAFAADDGIEIPLLILHDYDRHVGWVTLEHRHAGLHFTGQLMRDGPRRIRDWRGLSIGFVSASIPVGRTRRHLTGQVLELSVCPRGAHHPHSYIDVLAPARLAVAA